MDDFVVESAIFLSRNVPHNVSQWVPFWPHFEGRHCVSNDTLQYRRWVFGHVLLAYKLWLQLRQVEFGASPAASTTKTSCPGDVARSTSVKGLLFPWRRPPRSPRVTPARCASPLSPYAIVAELRKGETRLSIEPFLSNKLILLYVQTAVSICHQSSLFHRVPAVLLFGKANERRLPGSASIAVLPPRPEHLPSSP